MANAYFDTSLNDRKDEYIVLKDFKLQRDWSRFGGQPSSSTGRMQYFMEISITDPEISQFLTDNEYPVKVWVPSREGEESVPETHMKVTLPFNDDPKLSWLTPVIKLYNINAGTTVDITKENVAQLDSCDIDHVNLRIRKFKGRNVLGITYVQAQLVYGEIYSLGKLENARANLTAPIEAAQTPTEDLPF